jgi:hypothetical protein
LAELEDHEEVEKTVTSSRTHEVWDAPDLGEDPLASTFKPGPNLPKTLTAEGPPMSLEDAKRIGRPAEISVESVTATRKFTRTWLKEVREMLLVHEREEDFLWESLDDFVLRVRQRHVDALPLFMGGTVIFFFLIGSLYLALFLPSLFLSPSFSLSPRGFSFSIFFSPGITPVCQFYKF